MVATVGSISIDLITNAARFATGFRSAATTVDRESQRMTRSIQNADRAAASFVRNSIAGLAAGLGTREIGRYADAWTEAGNKIRAAGEVAGREGRSLQELNDIATQTRSGLTETVTLYSRLLVATEKVAKSEEEVARATEIVNKAFKAGGQASSEQAAGILQLSQALSSGFLQGDELRSLRENAPLLLRAIAEEFGTTIGGLKALGAEGKLTSDRIFKAILKGQKDIDAAFAQTKATLADNLEILKNAGIELVGTLDQSTGASAALAERMTNLAKSIRDVAAANGELSAAGFLGSIGIDPQITEGGFTDNLIKAILKVHEFGLATGQAFGIAKREATDFRDILNGTATASAAAAEAIKAKIAELEQKMLELDELGTEIDLFNRDRIAEDIDYLKAKLAELGAAAQDALSEAIIASENSRRTSLKRLAGISPSAGDASLPSVTKYGQETAKNTERTADLVENQTAELYGGLQDIGDILKYDVTGSFANWFSQLIYAQNLVTQSISEAVQTGIVTGLRSGESTSRKQYSISTIGIKDSVKYAGAFESGGSFIAPGNQTGDTTRLIMDVNGGERVSVSPSGADRPIILNYQAAPGENDRTSRQNARIMAAILARETARA